MVGAAATQAHGMPGIEDLDLVAAEQEVQVALVLADPALLIGGNDAPVAGVHAGDEGPAAAHPVAAVGALVAAEALDQDAGDQVPGVVAPDLVLHLARPLRDHEGMNDILHHRPAGRAAGGADVGDGTDDVAQRSAGPAVGRRLQQACGARIADHLPDPGQDRAVLAGLVSPLAQGGQKDVEIGAHGSVSVLHDDGRMRPPPAGGPGVAHHGDAGQQGQGRARQTAQGGSNKTCRPPFAQDARS